MFKIGHITSVDASKGLAKVKFDEDGIVSDWLQVLHGNTKNNKDSKVFDINEHVVVLVDENVENGFILGAIYSADTLPPSGSGKDVWMKTFSDGTNIKYNRSTHELNIQIGESGKVKITGDVEVTGKLKVSDDIESTTGNIEAKVGDVKASTVSLKLHTHMIQAVASVPPIPPIPSGPPLP